MKTLNYILAMAGGIAMGGLGIGGGVSYFTYNAGLEQGQDKGYQKGVKDGIELNQPIIGSVDYDGDGNLELCVLTYDQKSVCTGDFNEDGLQDVAVFDKDLNVIDFRLGKRGSIQPLKEIFGKNYKP